MPTRDSRYAGAPGSLRVLPEAQGSFTLTLAEGERLDHLAARYYRDPRRWWRICDANPEFLSPLELVGGGPPRTLSVPLKAGVPLHAVADRLAADNGVVRFLFLADPESDAVAALVTYNRVLLDQTGVLRLLAAERDTTTEPQPIGRAGKQITIPPDSPR